MATVHYTRGRREAVWNDGLLDGDELLVDLIKEAAVRAPIQAFTPTGPFVLPGLFDQHAAFAAGLALDMKMDVDPPFRLAPPGVVDGPGDIASALVRAKIVKHLAGTEHDHDQSTHGRRGGGGAKSHGAQRWAEAMEQWHEQKELREKLGAYFPQYGLHSERFGHIRSVYDSLHFDDRRDMDMKRLLEHSGIENESAWEFWERHAENNVIGRYAGADADAPAEALDYLKSYLDEATVYVRMDGHVLAEALTYDDRMRTQVDTQMSNGWFNPEGRMMVTEVLHGTDWGDSSEVPIYGYVALHPFDGPFDVEHYGNVAIELKDGVKPMTTVTLGDSLDDSGIRHVLVNTPTAFDDPRIGGDDPFFAPTPMTSPDIGVLDGLVTDVLRAKEMAGGGLTELSGRPGMAPYIEAQIHEPVLFGDSVKAYHVGGYRLGRRLLLELQVQRRLEGGRNPIGEKNIEYAIADNEPFFESIWSNDIDTPVYVDSVDGPVQVTQDHLDEYFEDPEYTGRRVGGRS